MTQRSIRIVQLSDLHLFAEPEKSLLGINTQESFEAVIAQLREDPKKADMILLSGDLSQDGTELAYIRIASLLKDFNVPIYCIPGNHDDGKIMAKIYPRETVSAQKHVVLNHWHIILLDTQKPGAVEGHLDRSQLNYLQHCLQAYPEHHAIIVFHHPPLSVGCAWLDPIGLSNADDFWQVVAAYPKAELVLFGHVHQAVESEKQGVKCYSCPSTFAQFKKNSKEFKLEHLSPGYRWIDLFANGQLETGIIRASHYQAEFDATATEY